MSITLTKSDWIKLYFLFCLFFLSNTGSGQIVRSARYDVPVGNADQEAFRVISAGETGVVLYRRAITDDNRVGMQVIRLDTALHQVWQGFIPMDFNLTIEQACFYHNQVYILLRNPFQAIGNFAVMRISPDQQEYFLYKINNAIPFVASTFAVTDTAALIGGYYIGRPLVLSFGFVLQQSRILPGFLNEPGDLVQMKVHDDGAVDVIVAAKNLERRKTLWIRNYDPEGNLGKTIVLNPGTDKHLLFGQSVRTPGKGQVVTGVYGRHLEYSRGVFVAHIDPQGEYRIDYYNFGDLQHFFSYMKARHEKRIRERIERKKIKGKKLRFNYRLLVHDLIPYHDKFLLIGEAFFPVYRYLGDFYSRGVIFDGYKYTHAVVIGFSRSGKLLWDNSFEISDVKSYELKPYVKAYPDEDRIVMLYTIHNEIRTMIVQDDKVTEGKSDQPPQKKERGRKLPEDNVVWSQLDYWYDGYFYSYGVQHLKSPVEDSPSRNQFFIEKVKYH